jgi:large subunit ribosomal protein L1
MYDLENAYKLLKSYEIYRFKQAFNINIKLGTDPKKSDQNVRGVCILPKGLGKEIRVCFYAKDQESIELAKQSGADMIATQQILEGFALDNFPFDVLYSTVESVNDLKRYAKHLGPKGLFPNTKAGTLLTKDQILEQISLAKKGKIEIRNNDLAEIKCAIGKLNMTYEDFKSNLRSIVQFLDQHKPKTLKKDLIQKFQLSCTGGPGFYLYPPVLEELKKN